MSRIAIIGAVGKVPTAKSYSSAVRLTDRGNLLRDRYLEAVRELYPARPQLSAKNRSCCR